jgi:CRISPR-associated endonuclease/helicase Cas3
VHATTSGNIQLSFRTIFDPDAGSVDGSVGRVDHSTFGARYVAEKVGKHKVQILAHCIAGHHSGLPDGKSAEEANQRRTLERRLNAALYPIPSNKKNKLKPGSTAE